MRLKKVEASPKEHREGLLTKRLIFVVKHPNEGLPVSLQIALGVSSFGFANQAELRDGGDCFRTGNNLFRP